MRKWRAVTALFVAPMALYAFCAKEWDVRADPPVPTVVLLRPTTSDEVTTEAMARVKGELKAAGFEVAVLPMSSDDAKRDLETAGRQLSPIAAFAIFVRPSAEGTSVAEIWVSDRIRQKTVIQNAILHETDRGRGSAILAVRAVELLKASLADFWTPSGTAKALAAGSATPRPQPVTAARESADEPRAPFASGLGAGIGVGFMESFGAMAVTWAPDAMVSYGWPQGFSLRASFVGLGPSVTLSAENGTAVVEQQLAMLEAVKTWWPRSALVPFVSAAAGAQHVHISGTAVAFGYRGHTPDNWSLLTTIGVGVGVPLVSMLSLVLQARGVAAWPPTSVQIVPNEVGSVGTPSLFMDGGLLGVLP
jgi:hypothetical protein